MSAVPRRGAGSLPASIRNAWLVLLVLAMVAWLGSYPLMQPDEGRNAEVAREMATSGNFIVPRLNGLPYVDKPFLSFAAVAISLHIFGATEFGARFPSLVFTLITAAMVGWFGRRVWSPDVGWTAATMSLSAPLAFGMSRVVILDALLAMLVVGSLISLFYAIEAHAGMSRGTPPGEPRAPWRRWSLCAWALIGLGILTKGPVALLIPLLAGLPYAAYRRALPAVLYPPAIALSVLIVAPWVAQMARAVPGYLHYIVVTEIWQRVTSDTLHRTAPFWFFIPVLAAGTFPWICMAVAGLWRQRRDKSTFRDPKLLFLMLWIVLPFLFFSLSKSKLAHYMLPLVPAVALLAAVLAVEERESQPPGRVASSLLLCFLGFAAISATVFVQAGRHVDPATLLALKPFLWIFAVVAIGSGAVGLLARPRGAALVAVFSMPMIVAGLASGPLLKAAGADLSAQRLAQAIREAIPGKPLVVGARAFPTSLPFYLRAPIEVASVAGYELTSNYVVSEFPALVAATGSTLHTVDWWHTVLAECRSPAAFVIRLDDVQSAAIMSDAGVRRLVADRKYAVYGPCKAPNALTK